MTTVPNIRTYAFRDSMTMLRRNLTHARRYPSMTLMTLAMPVFILLLFVGVFGGTLGTGIGGVEYIDYVAPAIILMAATSGAVSTAVSVATDMKEGIINRFRTMSISRGSVLTGHVVGGLLQTMVSLVLVTGVALTLGFRPNADVVEWLAAAGVLALLVFGLTWIAAAMGLVSKTVESASNLPIPFTFLPMLGSGFVPTESMPAGVRWFADYQPFTPMTETLRGLLLGTGIGNNALLALGWGAVLALVGYLWARSAFRRTPNR